VRSAVTESYREVVEVGAAVVELDELDGVVVAGL
jgi:hypothetical protein